MSQKKKKNIIRQAGIRPAELLVPQGVDPSSEVVASRTKNSKTFLVGENKYRKVSRIGYYHYKNEDKWEEIDLTLKVAGNKARCETAPYNVRVFTNKVGYIYTSKKGGTVRVELYAIDGKRVRAHRGTCRVEHNQLFWDDVTDGVDMKAILFPSSVEIFKILRHDKAPRKFTWRVWEQIGGGAVFNTRVLGFDNDKDTMQIEASQTPGIMVLDQKTGESYKRFDHTEGWNGKAAKIADVRTRKKQWRDTVSYPMIIDASTSESIEASNDDGEENQNDSTWAADAYGDFVCGLDTNATVVKNGGVRFQGVAVPQGATIDAATLKLNVTGFYGNSSVKLIIYGDDVDSAAAWASNSRPSQVTKTTASKSWTASSTGDHNLDVGDIVQEIVNRGGWVSGNDMRFAILDNGNTTTGVPYVYSYDGGTTNDADLDITYTEAAAESSTRHRHVFHR